MQWLQVVAAVFYADFYSAKLEVVLQFPDVEKATWLGLGAILSLALGMRLSLDSYKRGLLMAESMERNLLNLSLGRSYQAWWTSFIIASVLGAVAWKFGAFRQFSTPLLSIKWVFFFIFTYRVLVTGAGYGLLAISIIVEFVTGMTGYFSSFKEVLMMLVIVAMSLPRSLNLKNRGLVIAAVVIGFVASVFWSVVKMEYRDYLKTRWQQKGSPDFATRVEAMKFLASTVNAEKMDEGFKALVARVSYTGLFGATVNHVPAFEPHARGELWLGAVRHVLMPRILFPNKKVLDDSERARRFTGIRLAGAEEGTSIGIGYVAESYADFGVPGMFFPICLLGMLMAWIYQKFCGIQTSGLVGTAVGTAVLFTLILSFATSNGKVLGSLITISLAYAALNKVFGAGLVRWFYRG
jgi:hypothetical protein